MANSKLRCTYCKKYRPRESVIQVPVGNFCCQDHLMRYGIERTDSLLKKSRIIERQEHNKKKKGLITRAQWYNKLQPLVNQFVKFRDKDKGCCTCGTTKPTIKYDAGHCFTKKARPDIRFDLHNIHKQCSMNCNQHGSGMRAEYKVFIVDTYGQEELERLESEGEPLKNQFPTRMDIEEEILRYRKLLRDNGVTPNA